MYELRPSDADGASGLLDVATYRRGAGLSSPFGLGLTRAAASTRLASRRGRTAVERGRGIH